MAFRTNSMQGYWKSMANALRTNSNTFTTSTPPKLKAYASPADRPSSGIKSKAAKGDYFPLLVSAGMICLSASFGLYTVWHQLGEAPNVFVNKSRRGTLPEVVEPERVAADAERFVKQSFFRKIAHIQDVDRQEVMDDPIRGDVLTRPVRVESLKDVGVPSD
ncbi:hypothetical protein ACS0TY_031133 [Phlomoides rotata]